MRVHPVTNKIALLYRRDENYMKTGTLSSPMAVPYKAWLEVRDPATGALQATWDAGVESSFVDAVTSTAQDDHEWVIGSSGHAEVLYIPRSASGSTKHVRVGTSAEHVLLPQADHSKIFSLARLGGSKLVVLPQSPTATGTHHDTGVVGYWPCGMAQDCQGSYLYVLSHLDRTFRVLNAPLLAGATSNNLSSALISSTRLPAVSHGSAGGTLDYQVSDTVSALASSADGTMHLALFNELGEAHFVETSGASVTVKTSISLLPLEIDGGPGRMQGAVGQCGTDRVAFIYEKESTKLHRYVRGTSGWTHTGSTTGYPTAKYVEAYSRNGLFFNPYDCTVSVYDQVWDASAAVPTTSWPMASLIGFPVGARIIAARSANRLYVQDLDSSKAELLEDVSKVGTIYSTKGRLTMFASDVMKSGNAMRAGSGGTWEGAFSEPHLGNVHWYTGLP